jgi:ferric-dicitrate binding protein FerR (iron transport regulator)
MADDDDQAALRRAAQAAQAHAEAVRGIVRFVEDLDDLPGPDSLVEYAHLEEVEEEARQARTAALADIGLSIPSLDPDQE